MMYSKVRVIYNYGIYKYGDVLEVIEIVPDRRMPRSIEYVVIKGGNTIPRGSVAWL